MRTLLIVSAAAGLLLAGCRDAKTIGVFDGGPGADASRLPIIDGGPPTDADLTPVGKIQQAKNAADGPVNIEIEIVTVTYVKPAVGDEGAGFFVQAEEDGPALFLAVDPDSVEPNPAVGDEVAFTITEMGSASGDLRQATVIADYTRQSTGGSVEDFYQTVTNAADLVTSLAAYDSELIEIEATITGDFGFGGNGHLRAVIATTGLPDDDMLAVRIPAPLEGSLQLTAGCSFVLRGVMWRFGGTAQPSGFVEADFSDVTCAAPRVLAAVAASDTSVIVTFDRPLDEGSVLANGSQFTVDQGVTVSAAVASSDTVTITTSTQTPATDYTVTVAGTVTDGAGTGVDAGFNTAMFTGFTMPAAIVINEVNANLPVGCDLVEIRALSAGSIGGFQLWQRQQSVLTFPDMSLAAGDFVVVHLGSLVACNDTGAVNETTSKSSAAAATHPQNFDTAFDLYTATGGLTATSNVLTLQNTVGTIVDAVLLHNSDTNVAGSSEARAAQVASAGQWTDTGGMVPAGGFVNADFVANAVAGLGMTDTTPGGTSIQRNSDTDDDDMDDWAAPAASTWGALNAGQSTP